MLGGWLCRKCFGADILSSISVGCQTTESMTVIYGRLQPDGCFNVLWHELFANFATFLWDWRFSSHANCNASRLREASDGCVQWLPGDYCEVQWWQCLWNECLCDPGCALEATVKGNISNDSWKMHRICSSIHLLLTVVREGISRK